MSTNLSKNWRTLNLDRRGSLNIPADVKKPLDLKPDSRLAFREINKVLVMISMDEIPDQLWTDANLDAWVREKAGFFLSGAPAAPSGAFPPSVVTDFSLMLQGKPAAPGQRAEPDQRSWHIVVDGKGHLTIPDDLRRLLGQYGPSDLLVATLRYDIGEAEPVPVICFRAITTTAQRTDVLSNIDLFNQQKEHLAVREKRIGDWNAALTKKQEELDEREKVLNRAEERAKFLANMPHGGTPAPVAAWDKPPTQAAPGYKMVKTDLGWMEVADIDQETTPGETIDG